MSLIKIFANGIEIDIVKETLSIKTENNALSRDFKVSSNSYPFLIIENLKTKQALGTRDLSSIKKNKNVVVTVFEGDRKYFGELQILSFLNGFRKCNLKYSSVVLSIMSKKITEFMPIISVIPDEENPIPFSETSDMPLNGSSFWKTFPFSFLNKNYPEVKWQFPTMKWINKYGVDLKTDDDWYAYKNHINLYENEYLVENKFTIVNDECKVENKNVVAPQVFLLSPLFYALQSIQFKAIGQFVDDTFIQKILFQSSKNNLTETHPLKTAENVPLPDLIFQNQYDDEDNVVYSFFYSILPVIANIEGTYIFDYEIFEPKYEYVDGYINRKMFQIFKGGEEIETTYQHNPNDPAKLYKGSVKIEVSSNEIGNPIFVRYYSPTNVLPSYLIGKSIVYPEKYMQMHPTIDFGRYIPDWTFGTYLNELQKLFNLEITLDDFSQKMILNFNEHTIKKSSSYVIKKSLELKAFDLPTTTAYLLKYDNDQDEALWITTNGNDIYNNQIATNSETFSSKFKFVPTTYTAELSESLDNKTGTGLMIYNPEFYPYTAKDFLGQTLQMSGSKGIHQMFWKKFIKFLFNAGVVELTGPFTEHEKNQILKQNRLFIDHQEYMISTIECSETKQNNIIIKFKLYSITF